MWRAEGRGTFLTLSQRAPIGNDLFDQVDVRDFAPSLRVGDRLNFALRANATRTKRDGGRVDVVMDALRLVPQAERAAHRMQIAQTEATAWLERQGARAGFELHTTQAEEYTTLALSSHRGPRKGRPQFGILSLSGMIEVTDPDKLLAQIGHGFGRAKAYGCGLMLIRRSL